MRITKVIEYSQPLRWAPLPKPAANQDIASRRPIQCINPLLKAQPALTSPGLIKNALTSCGNTSARAEAPATKTSWLHGHWMSSGAGRAAMGAPPARTPSLAQTLSTAFTSLRNADSGTKRQAPLPPPTDTAPRRTPPPTPPKPPGLTAIFARMTAEREAKLTAQPTGKAPCLTKESGKVAAPPLPPPMPPLASPASRPPVQRANTVPTAPTPPAPPEQPARSVSVDGALPRVDDARANLLADLLRSPMIAALQRKTVEATGVGAGSDEHRASAPKASASGSRQPRARAHGPMAGDMSADVMGQLSSLLAKRTPAAVTVEGMGLRTPSQPASPVGTPTSPTAKSVFSIGKGFREKTADDAALNAELALALSRRRNAIIGIG